MGLRSLPRIPVNFILALKNTWRVSHSQFPRLVLPKGRLGLVWLGRLGLGLALGGASRLDDLLLKKRGGKRKKKKRRKTTRKKKERKKIETGRLNKKQIKR